MFGEMRRKKQALPLEACEKILERGTSGVLALEGEEGYPYAVQIIPEEYTTYFRSVIVFGKICILEGEAEKRRAIEKLALKYAPEEPEEKTNRAIDREFSPLCMLELSIEHISGKEAIELVRENRER